MWLYIIRLLYAVALAAFGTVVAAQDQRDHTQRLGDTRRAQDRPDFSVFFDKVEHIRRRAESLREQLEGLQAQLGLLIQDLDYTVQDPFARSSTPSTVSVVPTVSTSPSTRFSVLTEDVVVTSPQLSSVVSDTAQIAAVSDDYLSVDTTVPDVAVIVSEQLPDVVPSSEDTRQDHAAVVPSAKQTYSPAMARDDAAADKESAVFSSAMQPMQKLDYVNLRKKLLDFIADYPDSIRLSSANYWIAETYFLQGSYDTSLKYFRRSARSRSSELGKGDESMLKMAEIYTQRQEYRIAESLLRRVQKTAEKPHIARLSAKYLVRISELKKRQEGDEKSYPAQQ